MKLANPAQGFLWTSLDRPAFPGALLFEGMVCLIVADEAENRVRANRLN